MPKLISLLVSCALWLAACADDAAPPALRLNHLQALGSHNSYHTLRQVAADPRFDYVHAPLAEQLDLGVRHVEIDVHRDPVTGDIAVYHVKILDEGSSCPTWRDCLQQLRAWSDAHPEHHLLIMLLEPKDDLARFAADLGKDPAPTGELLWDGHVAELEAAVRETWPDRLLTPEHVRGRAATLREAITTVGWPTIDDTRQQLAIVLNETDEFRAEYRAVAAPLFFVLGDAGDDDQAFMSFGDPVGDADAIAAALEAGFMVRTRADAETEVDPAVTAASLTSGAQLISTDYPIARDDGAHPGYRFPWPGTPEHPSRCNPVTAPPDCRDADIE